MNGSEPRPVKTLVYVCVTCRPANPTPDSERPGAILYAALAALAERDPAVEVLSVECLSVCKRPCTVGFAAPGKWTYVYGDLPADVGADVVLAGARLYGASADGLIPWRQRPLELKKGVVARMPPLPMSHPVSEIPEAAE